MANKTLNKREVVSSILLVTLIMMPISAIIVHVAHGKAVSHLWLHIHVVFGVLFAVAGIFHVAYNWRTLKHYLTGKK